MIGLAERILKLGLRKSAELQIDLKNHEDH